MSELLSKEGADGFTSRTPSPSLRICMLAYSFYEQDNRVMRYAEALAKRGDQVDVISLYQPDVVMRGQPQGIRMFRIQKRARNETGPLHHLAKIMIFFLKSLALISFQHVREPYDLIHVHSMPDFLVFAACLPRLTGAKVILDVHDLLPEMYAEKFSGRFSKLLAGLLLLEEKLSCRLANHVIIANHLWAERLRRRSTSKNRSTVILNYPDPVIFATEEPKLRSDRFTFVYPGSLHWHQGLDLAIRALARVRKGEPQAELRIVGDGPERNNLMKLTHELELDDHVIFGDAVPTRVVPSILSTADVGVVPKRADSFGNEAFSTKILEFMAVGLPVIVSDTKIDRYYFNDTVVRFFRSGDVDSLAEAMCQMIRNDKMRHSLVENARSFVKSFDWEIRKPEYLRLVNSLCTG